MKETTMRYAHSFCSENFEYLQQPQNCRCIYCLKEYNSTEIVEYTQDNTAMCPYCWIDAVIGERSGFCFTDQEALEMHEFFFGNNGNVSEHVLDLLDKGKYDDVL